MWLSVRSFNLIWLFMNATSICIDHLMVEGKSMGKDESNVAKTRNLRETAVLQITSIQLVDTSTAASIVNFTTDTNKTVINLATLKTKGLTILAETSDDVESVKFGLGANATIYKTESNAPYTFCGDNGIQLYPCPQLVVGTHTITITPFSENAGGGVNGTTRTITFSIVNTTAQQLANNASCKIPKVSYQIYLKRYRYQVPGSLENVGSTFCH